MFFAVSKILGFFVVPSNAVAMLCALGALLASLVCERFARRYLHRTLGRLRRVADDVGRDRNTATMEVQPGDDFYKLVSAVNLMATPLTEASAEDAKTD